MSTTPTRVSEKGRASGRHHDESGARGCASDARAAHLGVRELTAPVPGRADVDARPHQGDPDGRDADCPPTPDPGDRPPAGGVTVEEAAAVLRKAAAPPTSWPGSGGRAAGGTAYRCSPWDAACGCPGQPWPGCSTPPPPTAPRAERGGARAGRRRGRTGAVAAALEPATWAVLEDIVAHGGRDGLGGIIAPTNSRRLAAHLGLSKDAAARALGRLVHAGLVVRVPGVDGPAGPSSGAPTYSLRHWSTTWSWSSSAVPPTGSGRRAHGAPRRRVPERPRGSRPCSTSRAAP